MFIYLASVSLLEFLSNQYNKLPAFGSTPTSTYKEYNNRGEFTAEITFH
jgi:hypothetical protein